MNASGGRYTHEPFAQFQPLSTCEVRAAKRYYSDVFSVPCAQLSGLDSWRCLTLNPASMSVASTNAVIACIFSA